MADAPAPKMIPAFNALNEKILVPETSVKELAQKGGRLATEQELAADKLDAQYAEKSTAAKIGGAVTAVGAFSALRWIPGVEDALPLPPSVEAYRHGVGQGASAGLGAGAVRQALQTVDPEAAKKFEQNHRDLEKAHEAAFKSGEVAGLVGSSVAGGAGGGAGAALPGAVVSRAGAGAASVAAKALGGAAAKGALGRALATGAELGVQGGVEGALLGAGQSVGEDMLGDHKVNAEKLWAAVGNGALTGMAAGAALGAGGSLVKSGVGATVDAARGGLARVLSKGQTAATDAAETAVAGVEGAAVSAQKTAGKAAGEAIDFARKAAPQESPLGKLLGGKADEAAKDIAYEQAVKALGDRSMAGKYVQQAERYLPGGAKDLGEVMLRRGVIGAEGEGVAGVIRGARTPAELLPRIHSELEKVGQQIGDITASVDAKVAAGTLAERFEAVAQKYAGKFGPENKAAGEAVRADMQDMLQTLGLGAPGAPLAKGEKLAASVQDVLELRKQYDRIIYAQPLSNKLAVEARREARGELEKLVLETLDEASTKAGGGPLSGQLKSLKKDYAALRIGADMTEDTAAKMSRNNTMSLGDMIAAGSAAAGGHVLAAPVVGLASSVIRPRINAAAAGALYRMSELGAVSRAMAKVDEAVSLASKGALLQPKMRPSGTRQAGNVVAQARRIISEVRAAQADAEAHAERVTQRTSGLSQVAPRTADALTTQTAAAIAMLASEIPAKAAMSPMRTGGEEPLSPMVAHKIVTMAKYINEPLEFFRDVENGHVSPEGVRVISQLMPKTYEQLQVLTLEEIGAAQAKGKPIDFNTRIRLSTLLDVPGDASMKPDFAKLLQQNVTTPPPEQSAPSGGGSSSGGSLTQPATSGLDRIESR